MHSAIGNPLVDLDVGLGLMGSISRSTYYAQAAAGLTVRPVKIGPRRSALPANEIDQINRAKIAGASDDDIRALVARLHALRAAATV